MKPDLTRHDQVVHFWCPQLGQTLHFGYCRQMNQGLPCTRVAACFSPHFDVEAFLLANYSPEELARCQAPAPGRLDRVGEALAAVRPDREDEKP
ncbi:MAG: hypothetical protein V1797_16640 [Pseudomonadota bacterium]